MKLYGMEDERKPSHAETTPIITTSEDLVFHNFRSRSSDFTKSSIIIKDFMIALVAAIFVFFSPQAAVNPRVGMEIENRGKLVIELFPKEAPRTVEHFLDLVKKGFYNGVRFHRVENKPRPFIVVTGDPLTKTLPLDDERVGTGGSGKKVPFEKNDIPFLNGTLGLVRDEKDENSGDSQFFICIGNQRFLDGRYVAFGRVVEGLEIIPKIQRGDKIVRMFVMNQKE